MTSLGRFDSFYVELTNRQRGPILEYRKERGKRSTEPSSGRWNCGDGDKTDNLLTEAGIQGKRKRGRSIPLPGLKRFVRLR